MAAIATDRKIVTVPVADILETPNMGRYREKPTEAQIDALAESIKEFGQQTPVRLRASKSEPGKYEIVAGQTRVAACRKLDRTVLAEIADDSDENALLQSIEENFRRGEVNVLDTAIAMQRLKKFRWKQKDIAKHFGYTDGRVSQLLSILELPQVAIDAIADGSLTPTAAIQLINLTEDEVANVLKAAYVTQPSSRDETSTVGYYETARINNAVAKIKRPEAAPEPTPEPKPGEEVKPEAAEEVKDKVPGKKELTAELEKATTTISNYTVLATKLNTIAATVSSLHSGVRESILAFAAALEGNATPDDVVIALAKAFNFDPNVA